VWRWNDPHNTKKKKEKEKSPYLLQSKNTHPRVPLPAWIRAWLSFGVFLSGRFLRFDATLWFCPRCRNQKCQWQLVALATSSRNSHISKSFSNRRCHCFDVPWPTGVLHFVDDNSSAPAGLSRSLRSGEAIHEGSPVLPHCRNLCLSSFLHWIIELC